MSLGSYQLQTVIGSVLQSNAHWHRKIVQYQFYRWGKKLLAKLTRSHTKYTPIQNNHSRTLHTAPFQINDILFDYFENLYRATPTNIDTFLSTLSLPHLTPDQQAHIDTPQTEEEVRQAITASSNGKTPGPDCYTAEFNKMLLPDILPTLTNLF